jgi:RHS repeat-associated protein
LVTETVWLEDIPVAVLKPDSTGLYYVHTDHLATPRMVSRPSDNHVEWLWDNVEPFGNVAPDQNPSGDGLFSFNARFPGQYFDVETGKHYNYFRDYDPSIGRYVESDPIGLDGGMNTYAYVDSNPLGVTDPAGLSPIKLIALCAKGYKTIKTVGFEEAVRMARQGKNILAGSRDEAKKIANAASGGKKPIKDPAHPDPGGSTDGRRPHYHPNPRNGSHIFYSIIAGVTVSHYVQCDDPNQNCTAAVLAGVADFFNPLAIGQDAVDIVDGLQ